MSQPLKAAVLGAGSMGQNHIRIYHELEQVELVAIADASPEARERTARRYGVRAYDSPEALLAAEQPDLVTIAAPTNLHAALARQTIGRGIATLIEKPIAATVAEGEELVRLAAERGTLVGIGHVERFNPAITELKRRLDAGQLGQIFQISARRIGPFPARIQDVGVVIDLATHDLDAMHYLTGSTVARLRAELGQRLHTNHEDLLTALLRFESGVIGTLEINWLSPAKVRTLSVLGERGMFVANYLTQELMFYENAQAAAGWEQLAVMGVSEGQMIRYNIPKREPLREELLDFIAAVRDGRPPLVSAAEGLRALAVAEQLISQANQ